LKTAGCTAALSASLAPILRSAYYAAAADAELQREELVQVLGALRDAGVTPVLFKGAALAYTVYPDPACRPMGDLDLWVTAEAMPRAREALKQCGYAEWFKTDRPPEMQALLGGEVQLVGRLPGQGLVELHWGAFAGAWLDTTARVDHAAVLCRAQPVRVAGQPAWTLSGEDAVIQLAVHLAVNHQMAYPGVRALLDIALLACCDQIDWPALAERAAEWRVGTATWLVLWLTNELFGLPGAGEAIHRLAPSPVRTKILRRYVTTRSVVAGEDMTGGPRRFLFQLLLVDRPVDAARLVARALWPERQWLRARYGSAGIRFRVRHLLAAARGKV
jgi:hypothetical protein